MAFSVNSNTGSERRQFRRIKTSSLIEYKFFNSEKFQETLACDISEGGVSFLSNGPLPLGIHVYFQVRLKNRPQAIYGIAKIVWSSKEPYSEKYKIGLEFTEVGTISKIDITNIIEENKTACVSY